MGVFYSSADELDAFTRTAKGGDAARDIQRLDDSLKQLRKSFQEAKDLATGSEEAAAKCQVGVRWNAAPVDCALHFMSTRIYEGLPLVVLDTTYPAVVFVFQLSVVRRTARCCAVFKKGKVTGHTLSSDPTVPSKHFQDTSVAQSLHAVID